MGKLTLTDTINQISRAYMAFANAKSDRDDVIESAIDAYYGETIPEERRGGKKLMAAHRKHMALRKAEIRNIKKLAKAMMTGDKEGLVAEVDNMKDLTDAIA